MNKIFLKYFAQQLEKIPYFTGARVFCNLEGLWTEFGQQDHDLALVAALNEAKIDQSFDNIRGFPETFFFLGLREICVALQLRPKPRAPTIARHRDRLEECFGAATSSFHAHHDELTGVLNRHGLKHALAQLYTSSVSDAAPASSQQQTINHSDVILFAFDIDHFKSVNDTYGHDAGDTVLSTFASRISGLVDLLEQNYRAKFIFGRPGGEEFELLAVGAISSLERAALGEVLLEEVRKPFQFSVSKAGGRPSKLLSDSVRLPTKITASIGVAWAKKPKKGDELLELHASLRKDADTALYRAKADGRDCIRVFADIRRKHGRVLTFDSRSKLSTIDIGSKLGVEVGQVYGVCFVQRSQHVINKGHNQDTHSYHSFVESARIKVVAVTAESSIAAVVGSGTEQEIPEGALLRYVHMGCKLVTDGPPVILPAVKSLGSLLSDISELQRTEDLGAVLALGGRKNQGDERSLDEIRDEWLLMLTALAPTSSHIYRSLGSEIYAVLQRAGRTRDEMEANLISLADTMTQTGRQIYIGVCYSDSIPPHVSKTPEAFAFYARASLKSLSLDKSEIASFKADTPQDTLHAWRTVDDVENSLIDYFQFRQYGFHSSDLDNQLGLVILEAEATVYYGIALAAFSRAANGPSEDRDVFRANLGLLLTHQGDYLTAFLTLKSVEKDVRRIGSPYTLAFAKAALELKGTSNAMDSEALANLILEAANSYTLAPRGFHEKWWRELKQMAKVGQYD